MAQDIQVDIVSPQSSENPDGLSTTSIRIARRLQMCGVRSTQHYLDSYEPNSPILIVLNAFRSRHLILKANQDHKLIVVVITGTDLNEELVAYEQRLKVLSLCNIIVTLQPAMLEKIPFELHDRTFLIEQSALLDDESDAKVRRSSHLISYVANLRQVKNPETILKAATCVARPSNAVIIHCGCVLEQQYADWGARSRVAGRLRWVGSVPQSQALRVIAKSKATVICSRSEGGSNVLSEAVAMRTPLISSDNECVVSFFGKNYPGLYPIGNASRLAEIIQNIVLDDVLTEELRSAMDGIAHRIAPAAELEKWRSVVQNIRMMDSGSRD